MKAEDYLAHLEGVITNRPHYADAYNNLGLVLSYLGRHNDALSALDKALEINPHYVDSGLIRAFVLADSDKLNEGFNALKQIHVRSPFNFNILLSLGVFCMKQGWTSDGLNQMMNALKIKPTVPYMLAYTAAAQAEAGNESASSALVTEARSACRQADIDPDQVGFPDLSLYRKWENPYVAWRLRMLRANASAEESDFGEARREYLGVQAVYPGHVNTMVGLGRVALAEDKHEEAMQWFARAKAVDPDSHTALINIAFLHAENGDYEAAMENFEGAVTLRPLFPDYHCHLAYVLLEMGELEEAVEELQKALIINPGYGIASLLLARAYLAEKNEDKAVETIEAGACSQWPEALTVAARAHQQAGRKKKAVKCLTAALEADSSCEEAQQLMASIGPS